MNIEKNKYNDVEKWVPIKDIRNNIIILKNGNKVKLFRVEPINFELKSESEQISILEAYKVFLKNYNTDLQIIIQTDKVDLDEHIKIIEDFKKEKVELSDIADDYIKMVLDVSRKRDSVSRKFYMIVKLKNEKIVKDVEQCGNHVFECGDSEIVEVLKRYFNKETKNRKETKWV